MVLKQQLRLDETSTLALVTLVSLFGGQQLWCVLLTPHTQCEYSGLSKKIIIWPQQQQQQQQQREEKYVYDKQQATTTNKVIWPNDFSAPHSSTLYLLLSLFSPNRSSFFFLACAKRHKPMEGNSKLTETLRLTTHCALRSAVYEFVLNSLFEKKIMKRRPRNTLLFYFVRETRFTRLFFFLQPVLFVLLFERWETSSPLAAAKDCNTPKKMNKRELCGDDDTRAHQLRWTESCWEREQVEDMRRTIEKTLPNNWRWCAKNFQLSTCAR